MAIIRISGPLASQIYFSFCRTSRLKPYTRLPEPHKLVLRNIHHPHTHELLDSGAGVVYFPVGESYTGEESLELHVHGGLATVRDVLDALGTFSSSERIGDEGIGGKVRPAEAGEFTRRAFENGRLDLNSAEALHSLIDAETTIQRKVALQGTRGLQTARYDAIREELLKAMAMTEALIDFSDEDGVEEGTWLAAQRSVDEVGALLRSELGLSSTRDAKSGERSRRGR